MTWLNSRFYLTWIKSTLSRIIVMFDPNHECIQSIGIQFAIMSSDTIFPVYNHKSRWLLEWNMPNYDFSILIHDTLSFESNYNFRFNSYHLVIFHLFCVYSVAHIKSKFYLSRIRFIIIQFLKKHSSLKESFCILSQSLKKNIQSHKFLSN